VFAEFEMQVLKFLLVYWHVYLKDGDMLNSVSSNV